MGWGSHEFALRVFGNSCQLGNDLPIYLVHPHQRTLTYQVSHNHKRKIEQINMNDMKISTIPNLKFAFVIFPVI